MLKETAEKLAEALRNVDSAPTRAAEIAHAILMHAPNDPGARLLRAAALRAGGDPAAARDELDDVIAKNPLFVDGYVELAKASLALGDHAATADVLRRAVELAPGQPTLWRMLARALGALGKRQMAEAAWAQSIRASVSDERLREAGAALASARLNDARQILRARLAEDPDDLVALRMLADACFRAGRLDESGRLLRHALDLAPSFAPARYSLAIVLHMSDRLPEAIEQADVLLAAEPRNSSYRNLKAVAHARFGDTARAIELFESLLADDPRHAETWMNYGNALRAAGRREDAAAAYRQCIARAPSHGEAYWRLANLKAFRFAPSDLTAMRAALARSDISDEDRTNLHFALGKALEDEAAYAESFQQYELGNKTRRRRVPFDSAGFTAETRRSRALLDTTFFRARANFGAPARDPIFIVGLPRAGSTLIEQILASHTEVEGTWELPTLPAIVESLMRRRGDRIERYPDFLTEIDAAGARALGERYIEETRAYRKTKRPRFTDKLPNNFAYIGFIKLILPNAKIIDARRHPLGNCFSAFKQHFASGQDFSYDLEELGRYYRDYVALMAHFDRVLPGAVHRVIYERQIGEFENEVRRLLDYCELRFEPACLRFHETDRAVHTASSEQVRQPLFDTAVAHWRNYDPWLGPLKAILNPIIDAYPEAPSHFDD